MNKKWIADNLGRSLKIYFAVFALSLGVMGCAMLQETPPVEIPASRLLCEKNPEMVDGKLETVGIFEASGTLRKGFRRGSGSQRRYRREVIGSPKTETLIKLDTPTYIDYIEVYPASTIPNFVLDTTPEKISPRWFLSLTPVLDKRSQKVEGTEPVRFRIAREILYLRLTAGALEDSENIDTYSEAAIKEMEASLTKMNIGPEATEKVRQQWRKQRRQGEMQIPLKGAAIREVKFYGRE